MRKLWKNYLLHRLRASQESNVIFIGPIKIQWRNYRMKFSILCCRVDFSRKYSLNLNDWNLTLFDWIFNPFQTVIRDQTFTIENRSPVNLIDWIFSIESTISVQFSIWNQSFRLKKTHLRLKFSIFRIKRVVQLLWWNYSGSIVAQFCWNLFVNSSSLVTKNCVNKNQSCVTYSTQTDLSYLNVFSRFSIQWLSQSGICFRNIKSSGCCLYICSGKG